MFHILLGALFLTVKPYKKKWMNHADGLFLFTLGALIVIRDSAGEKFTFILGAVIATLVMVSALLYFICTCATINAKSNDPSIVFSKSKCSISCKISMIIIIIICDQCYLVGVVIIILL